MNPLESHAVLPPLLLPTPKECRVTATQHRIATPAVVEQRDFLPAEGYQLTVDERGVTITHGDAAGLRHAKATLDQLHRQYPEGMFPGLQISDAPVFATRGVMLDVSRDRIPTLAELERIIGVLASWKINHLQLYVEHTVAYQGHESVWQGTGALTLEELRHLESVAATVGITLAANQNCFGHLSAWFRHPTYAPLAEVAPDGWWDFNGLVSRQGGFSFCPSDPRALALVEDLLGQLLPTMSAPWVNIGCDETFDVGQGRSREEVAQRGRATVYAEFVAKVCAIASRHGKRPQFWADIALEHPEALALLPPDLLGLAWGYEGDAPFARWLDQLGEREAWVCPGTSSWRSFTGRTAERQANLLAAAREGAGRATGFLVTDWGDLGHRQQWPISLHGLAEAAHRAWSGTAPYDPRAGGLHAFGDAAWGPWLDALGNVDHPLRQTCGRTPGSPLRNATALFTDWHKPLSDQWLGTLDQWQTALQRLQDLPPMPSPDPEVDLALTQARLALERAVRRRQGDAAGLRRLAPEVRAAVDRHRQYWLARCRPGGLTASCVHDLAIAEDLERA